MESHLTCFKISPAASPAGGDTQSKKQDLGYLAVSSSNILKT